VLAPIGSTDSFDSSSTGLLRVDIGEAVALLVATRELLGMFVVVSDICVSSIDGAVGRGVGLGVGSLVG
jgi:hypothetical protein